MATNLDKMQHLENRIASARQRLEKAYHVYSWNEEEHTARQNELYNQILLLQSEHEELSISLHEIRHEWDLDLCDWSQNTRSMKTKTPDPPKIADVLDDLEKSKF